MKVSLVYSPAPRQVREWLLDLPAGASAEQAIECCDIFSEFPELQLAPLLLGIWGRRVGLNQILQEHNRIEIYRRLKVDPKVARRERFSRQGIKKTGLFSAVRPGAKAGY